MTIAPSKEKGCPAKRGEPCPYTDKKACPYRTPKQARAINLSREKTVYLIGTVHVSKESARKVEDTIRTVLPNMVCMELDLDRFRAMQEMVGEDTSTYPNVAPLRPGLERKQAATGQIQASEDWGLGTGNSAPKGRGEGGQFPYSRGLAGGLQSPVFDPVSASARQDLLSVAKTGPKTLDLFTMPGLLKWLQQQIGEEFGVAPGSEMLAAYQTAKRYGLNIALIDRPVGITLNRMWAGMKFSEKVKLMGYLGIASVMVLLKPLFGRGGGLLSALGDSKRLDISKLEKGEGVDDLMGELEKEFPVLYKALVEERNAYMCSNILRILRERADTLVVVVGMGHVSGMKALLETQGVGVVV